jgi:hypothetical protein
VYKYFIKSIIETKITIIREKTEAPLYDHILRLEAIELHKLICIIKQHGGVVLEVNTDSVAAVFADIKIHLLQRL